jgi:predicted dinucleotide-binding enzyme
VRELGANVTAVWVKDALQADIVVLAVHFGDIPELGHQVAPKEGRIFVDATNAIGLPTYTPVDLGGRPSSEVVAEKLAGARLVKAFDTLPAARSGCRPGPRWRTPCSVSVRQ